MFSITKLFRATVDHRVDEVDDTALCIRLLLAQQEALRALSFNHFNALTFAFVEKAYRGGEALVDRGQRNPGVFLILGGKVEIVEAGQQTRCVRGGSILSFLPNVDGSKGKRTCRALGSVRVARLSPAAIAMLLGTNSEIGHALIGMHQELSARERLVEASSKGRVRVLRQA
jgi:CRP-like cAMP-binding protein